MGKSFVYNTGSSEDDKKKEDLRFNFGVFFDGTLNNMYNTDARRKSRNETEKSFIDTQSDKYKTDLVREASDREDVLKDKKNGGLAKVGTPERRYQDYLLGVERDEFDTMGTDNSYSNDYTNVARMWTCCEKDEYRVYIEGMGSKELQQDSQDGFAFGSGETGIRARVRTACEKVAEKILDVRGKSSGNTKITEITIDIFGFSRGAASARNFAYEINKDQTKPRRSESNGGYIDADAVKVSKDLLIDGYLPPFGHLGLSLYKDIKVAITPEELKEINLNIRFIGIYDTVSSYYQDTDLYEENLADRIGKAISEFIGPTNFANDVEELHLNDIKCQKMVHFTAQDEHRKNFSLTHITPIKGRAIEKSFPGVHCDIGGAYENGPETIDEIATNISDGGGRGLSKITKNLTKNYWYKEYELDVITQKAEDVSKKYSSAIKKAIAFSGVSQNLFNYDKLTGTKSLVRKEYSYIPLHFMEEYARKTSMDYFFTREIVDDYPLETAAYTSKTPVKRPVWDSLLGKEVKKPVIIDHLADDGTFLERIKKGMAKYVLVEDNDDVWEFKTDEQLKVIREEKIKEVEAKELKENKLREDKKERQIIEDFIKAKKSTNILEIEDLTNEKENYINNVEQPKSDDITLENISPEEYNKKMFAEEIYDAGTLAEVSFVVHSLQSDLRILRHDYCHYSATRDFFGMEPNDDRKRRHYNKPTA